MSLDADSDVLARACDPLQKFGVRGERGARTNGKSEEEEGRAATSADKVMPDGPWAGVGASRRVFLSFFRAKRVLRACPIRGRRLKICIHAYLAVRGGGRGRLGAVVAWQTARCANGWADKCTRARAGIRACPRLLYQSVRHRKVPRKRRIAKDREGRSLGGDWASTRGRGAR